MDNQVLEVIKKRSSARAYSDEEVMKEQLEKVIEAGLQGPTGMNKKEIHFTVVKGDAPILEELDAEKRALRGQDKQPHNFYYEAPVLIFLSAEDDFKWSKVDSGIAVQNMAIAAESMGLGNLIIGFDKALAIPKGYSFQIALAVGHKTDNKTPHDYDVAAQVSYL